MNPILNAGFPETERDEVLEEIWRNKAELSAKFGHDISRYMADARKRLKESGIPTVNLQTENKD